ncbi:MAG: ABC transporter ATP-binding protein [Anaerolineae bacterium]|nr:ABC transporter ATP-binding protein [Anaerolineae bacterium]
MSFLAVDHLRKSYPDGWTLSDVAFTLDEGGILALLGPSGCGKTTLLRLIAGLEEPDGGRIRVDGADVTAMPPHRRGFGFMFQEYALFPHRNVFANVAFGLKMARWTDPAIQERVRDVLELVGLTGFERRDVNQLSGGERQRVALARSIAPQPRLVLLDEPLGALDRALRERLLKELPAILKGVGVTTITVTHDQEEAFAIADSVLVMRDGRVVQRGEPEAVYRQPATPWVARFLGLTNLLPGRAVGPGRVETVLGEMCIEGATGEAQDGPALELLIRPEAACLDRAGPNVLSGRIVERYFRGGFCRLIVRHASGVELTFDFAAALPLPAPGEPVVLSLSPAALTVF